MKLPKTNAVRLLDVAKVAYELITYHVTEDDLGATHVAEQLGEPIEQVFKTIVLRGDKTGVLVVVLPGDKEVDLKKIAKVSGNKSCAPLQQKELLPTTGYIRGGCSPIGMKKLYPTYFHTTCKLPIYLCECRGAWHASKGGRESFNDTHQSPLG